MTEKPLAEVGALAAARRRELKMDRAALARKAKVDPKTVRALEEGERWPRDKSRTQIESALDWPAGALERLRNNEPFAVQIDLEYLTRTRSPRDFEGELAQVNREQLPPPNATDLLILARDTPPEERTERQWELLHAAEERLKRLENPKPTSRPKPGYGGEALRIRARLAGIPEDEWPEEDRQYLRAAAEEHRRLAALAQRANAERPFIELVWEGQQLADAKTDPEVRAYVRKVESAVVLMVGIDRLNEQLETRRAEQLIIRANQAGVLVRFMEEVERLQEAGLTDREISTSMAPLLEDLLATSRQAPTSGESVNTLDPIESDKNASAEGDEGQKMGGSEASKRNRGLHRVTKSQLDRDLLGADAPTRPRETGSNITGSGDQVPSDDAAAEMTDAELQQAAAADPLWADYIKTKRPELVDDGWDF